MQFRAGARSRRETPRPDEFVRPGAVGIRKGHVYSDRRAKLSGGARSGGARSRLPDFRADRGRNKERPRRQGPERRPGAGARMVQLRFRTRAADAGARDADASAARFRRERSEVERPQTTKYSTA